MDKNINSNKQPTDQIGKKVKENKLFFYGFPVASVIVIFIGLLVFILPTINLYYKNSQKEKILNENNEAVDKSVSNLRSVLARVNEIDAKNNELNEAIPSDSKIGSILELIQTKAQDYNLEARPVIAKGDNKTSVDNLARKTDQNKAIFESINSGEVEFEPKSASDDGTEATSEEKVKAVLGSIEVNIKGDRQAFFDFVKAMKDAKPLVNLVFAEYSEEQTSDTTGNVSVVLRMESYSLKTNDKTDDSAEEKVEKDDPKLLEPIDVQDFDWKSDSNSSTTAPVQ